MADLRDEHGNPIQLTDEHGNPVKLTDEHGNPMHLSGVAYTTTRSTATIPAAGGRTTRTLGSALEADDQYAKAAQGGQYQPRRKEDELTTTTTTAPTATMTGATFPGGGTAREIRRPSSSSSSSSEDEVHEGQIIEGQGTGEERRKKKGVTQKLKEKLSLTGGKQHHKDTTGTTNDAAIRAGATAITTGTRPTDIYTSDTVIAKTTTEHHEHEKGGVISATDTTIKTTTVEHKDREKKGMMEKIMEKLPGHH